jgi:superfamily II DNA or RNA helicase
VPPVDPEFRGLSLALSPRGAFHLQSGLAEATLSPEATRRIQDAFAQGAAHGVWHLGLREVETPLPSALAWLRELGRRCVLDLRTSASAQVPHAPSSDGLVSLCASAPPFAGAEYLTIEALGALSLEVGEVARGELAAFGGDLEGFFQAQGGGWHAVGRVHLHLAENKGDPEQPFAFLATYVPALSSTGKSQHLSLGHALQTYAGTKNRAALLSLLQPLQRAAEQSALVRALVDSKEIFEAQAWSPAQAHHFLRELPALEAAGLTVRVPDWWKRKSPPRPVVKVTLGARGPSTLGMEQLLDFDVQVALDGEPLTAAELRQALAATEGLALLRGQWVEIDRSRLAEVLAHWKRAEQAVAQHGLSFAEGLRLLAGVTLSEAAPSVADAPVHDWSQVAAGPWLQKALEGLRDPAQARAVEPGPELQAALRPYQRNGLNWLWLMGQLGLGACLADDMGLGKTVQVIALLLALKKAAVSGPHLLVVPASLLANWSAELERFAPSLRVKVAHPSAMSAKELAELSAKRLEGVDAVITSYGSLLRLDWPATITWGAVVLDEAQNIKNPAAKQTRAVKAIPSQRRIALTGTPVENRLGDLWSLFDFLNPGLLGTAKQFTRLTQGMARSGATGYAPLRTLIRPYVLRRLKSDRSIISDLPDKTELDAFCSLSKQQAALYAQSVKELAQALQSREVEPMRRRGLVLAFLLRFKQICNHPDQWLGQPGFDPAQSGKFERLRALCEEIAQRQEKVLVFTQFQQMTEPLAQHLEAIFGRPGLVLHGETPVKQRQQRVKRFQEDEALPFFVLSVKAGGTGLNLTAASHVIHFDRWWNPAVENQATDRAYRIGQKRNVLVHRFIVRGTVEERIDALIRSKRALADQLFEGGDEIKLTELSNAELIELVSLDLPRALAS